MGNGHVIMLTVEGKDVLEVKSSSDIFASFFISFFQ